MKQATNPTIVMKLVVIFAVPSPTLRHTTNEAVAKQATGQSSSTIPRFPPHGMPVN